ncbi:unnamed protein product [Rotaria sp. Silwood1]|nr:unnamed protein product [Rotaria sp. Silwood1]CAF1605167.1 unnamed protein product [Rotaria sp. Silwood1]CAF3481476.1 unnamed protein product [Rotaria sp. Silwood1]CAF4954512.1 unnamed protein product [Rotaria sp. Silwood1]
MTLSCRFVGAILFGVASDRFGRKWPLIVNIILYGIIGISTGFCQSYVQFIVFRALYGVSMGGIYGNCASTALENAPIPARGLLSGLLQQGYVLGLIMAVIWNLVTMNSQSYGWRMAFWCGGCFPLLVALWRVFLPESQAFLCIQEERKKAAFKGITGLKVK